MHKKVLFVANIFGHFRAFHQPYMHWFKENGWEVHAAANNLGDISLPDCDKTYEICVERSPYKLGNVRAFFELKKIIDDNNYDLIYCHTPMGGILGRLAAIGARKQGTKVIYMCHGFQFYKGGPLKDWLLYYPVEFIMARFCDAIITINKDDYRLAKRMKKNSYRIRGIGIDTEKFKPDDELRRTTRESFGLSDNDFLILSVGELSDRKNHQVIVRAVAELNNPKVKYYIAGAGPKEQELKELIVELGLSEQVKLLGRRDDVPALCNAADLFAYPSVREGLGVAGLEAMACGLPLVSSTARGVLEYTIQGKNGYSCNCYDSYDFKEKILIIISDRDSISYMRKNSRKVAGIYSIDTSLRKWQKIIEMII